MKKLNAVTYDEAPRDVQKVFDGFKKKMGMIPNLYATTANSPAALSAILQYGETLKKGEFNAQEVEAIALSVSQENFCQYCLAAHTAIGKVVGLTDEETLNLRGGRSYDPKLNALVHLAKEIAETRGQPLEESINQFIEAGYSKAALVELIGFVSLNVFNNYLNHIADTQVDFPQAPELLNV